MAVFIVLQSGGNVKLSQKQQQRLAQAFALHEAGELEAAVSAYRGLLRALPVATVIISNLGAVLLQLGRREEGLPLLERSLRIDPQQPAVLAACAMAYIEVGRAEAALERCEQALRLAPGLPAALHTRGLALHMIGRYEDALASYAQLLVLIPEHFEALNNRGLSLLALERFDEAVQSFEKARQLQAKHVPTLQNLANAYSLIGRREDALEVCRTLQVIEPLDTECRLMGARLLVELRRREEAREAYLALTRMAPNDARVWFGFAGLLKQLKQYDEALAAYWRALNLDATTPFLQNDALAFGLENCQWDLLVKLWPTLQLVAIEEFRPFDTLRLPFSASQQLAAARHWAQRELGSPPAFSFPAPVHRAERKLRVGILSSDLHNHPVAYLMEKLMPVLARNEVHWVGITTMRPDPVPASTQALFDDWLDLTAMNGYEAADSVRAKKIDIAINLNGITAGERSELFAMRLAPIQASFLGYAGTTAMPAMDYLISDAYIVPEGRREFYTEHIAYMPDTFFVPNTADISAATVTRADEGLTEDGVVFCCFNNSYKITPDIFDIWMRLLDQVPGSVLWLSRANDLVETNLKKEATARGVDPQRLVFAKFRESRADHLRRLQLADLFLDTFYYNAHTTASDALWAGVPVLTCPGETFASRVAGSLLKAAGMEELIAEDRAAYESMALRLAQDRNYLAEVRAKLQRNRETQPIFDMPRYARNFERLLLAMWHRHEQGLPPGPIELVQE